MAPGGRVGVEGFHDTATGRRQAILIRVVARTGNGSPEQTVGY